jgi:addiction module RelE/StbE family toxin
MYKVFLTTQAEKDLKTLPKAEKNKIRKKLLLLEKEPFSGKKLSGKLANFYSLKVWPYRIIYIIDKEKEIWVVHIMHRQEGYGKLN